MNNSQRTAQDFGALAAIHARDGENVSRALVESLSPDARGALARHARDLAAMLEPNPKPMNLEDAGINSPVSALTVAGESEPKTAADRAYVAADALGLLR